MVDSVQKQSQLLNTVVTFKDNGKVYGVSEPTPTNIQIQLLTDMVVCKPGRQKQVDGSLGVQGLPALHSEFQPTTAAQ